MDVYLYKRDGLPGFHGGLFDRKALYLYQMNSFSLRRLQRRQQLRQHNSADYCFFISVVFQLGWKFNLRTSRRRTQVIHSLMGGDPNQPMFERSVNVITMPFFV